MVKIPPFETEGILNKGKEQSRAYKEKRAMAGLQRESNDEIKKQEENEAIKKLYP